MTRPTKREVDDALRSARERHNPLHPDTAENVLAAEVERLRAAAAEAVRRLGEGYSEADVLMVLLEDIDEAYEEHL